MTTTKTPSRQKVMFRKAMRLAGRVAKWAGRHAWRPVAFTGRNVRHNHQFRRGFLTAVAWVITLTLTWRVGAAALETAEDAVDAFVEDEKAEKEIEKAVEAGKPPPTPGTPAYVAKIRAARALIKGFNRDVLPHVTDEYNRYVRSPKWRAPALATA